MSKKRPIEWGILMAFMIYGCSGSLSNDPFEPGIRTEEGLDIIHVEVPTDKSYIDMSEVLDTMYLIPLGVDTSLNIGAIVQVEYFENQFYVLDNSKPTALIYVFEEDGSFSHLIGTPGGGPEEYASVERMNVNRVKRYVDVVGLNQSEIVRYTLDGAYIARFDNGAYGINFREMTELNDSTYVLYTSKTLNFTPSENGSDTLTYDLFYADENFDHFKYQFPFDYANYKGLSFFNVTHFQYYKGRSNLMIPLNDTVYVFDPEKYEFRPDVAINYSEKPNKSLFHLPSYDAKDIVFTEKPSYAYMTSQFWEVGSSIFFEYVFEGRKHIALADRKTGKVRSGRPRNDFYGYFPILLSATPSAYIGKTSYDELYYLYKEYERFPDRKEVLESTGGVESLERLNEYLSKYPDINQFLVAMVPRDTL